MTMAFKFKDNAPKKIIAIDFDGCLTQDNIFPRCGQPRRYAKEVTNLLHNLDAIVVIWTCRDCGFDDNGISHDDRIPAVDWMEENGIYYDAINTSIKYASWSYEARKIYANMYVDDVGFGWADKDDILLDVLVEFLYKHMGYDRYKLSELKCKLIRGEEVTAEWIRANCI
jgi:hypothetical protein